MFKTVITIIASSLILLYALSIPPLLILVGLFGGVMGFALLYFLFCAQLSVQAIITIVLAKRMSHFTQSMFAMGFILVLPLVLMIVIAPIFAQVNSPSLQLADQAWNIIIISAFFAQLAGSVWLWVLIAMTRKQAIQSVEQPVEASVQPFPIQALASAPPLPPRHARNKVIGYVVLALPFILFAVSVIATVIARANDPTFHATSQDTSTTAGLVVMTLSVLSSVSFIPCIITGIILIVKSR